MNSFNLSDFDFSTKVNRFQQFLIRWEEMLNSFQFKMKRSENKNFEKLISKPETILNYKSSTIPFLNSAVFKRFWFAEHGYIIIAIYYEQI